jgi:hypothetical protein
MPRKKESKSSNPEVARLIQVMTDHYVLIEKCSARIRHLPNSKQLYDDTMKKYMKNPLYRPPVNDEQARAKFFSSVDDLCKIEPNTPEKYVFPINPWTAIIVSDGFRSCYMIMFGCTVALQVLVEQDIFKMSGPDQRQVYRESGRLAYVLDIFSPLPFTHLGANDSMAKVKASKNSNPDIVAHPTSPSSMHPPPPPHLVPVLFPNASPDPNPDALFGAQIRYRDVKTGKVMECSVDDCVTSRLRGKYFIISYGEGEVDEVSEREMHEMLQNRVRE